VFTKFLQEFLFINERIYKMIDTKNLGNTLISSPIHIKLAFILEISILHIAQYINLINYTYNSLDYKSFSTLTYIYNLLFARYGICRIIRCYNFFKYNLWKYRNGITEISNEISLKITDLTIYIVVFLIYVHINLYGRYTLFYYYYL